MKKGLVLLLAIGFAAVLTACKPAEEASATQPTTASSVTQPQTTVPTAPTVAPATARTEQTAAPTTARTEQTDAPATAQPEQTDAPEALTQEEQHMTLQMTINGTPVAVEWEDNAAVDALSEAVNGNPLTIQMSMYGGFEQVGALGMSLPQDDVQTTTSAGDIVLYSGNQIVVFYGANTWAYTRLGHITDRGADGMAQLLSNGDVSITLSR